MFAIMSKKVNERKSMCKVSLLSIEYKVDFLSLSTFSQAKIFVVQKFEQNGCKDEEILMVQSTEGKTSFHILCIYIFALDKYSLICLLGSLVFEKFML